MKITDLMSDIAKAGPPALDQEMVVELIYDAAPDLKFIRDELQRICGKETRISIDDPFSSCGLFFVFVQFVDFSSTQQEHLGFELARALKSPLRAKETNFVGTDSFYGSLAAVEAGDDLMQRSLRLCETASKEISPIAWAHEAVGATPSIIEAAKRGAGAKIGLIDTGTSIHNDVLKLFASDSPDLNLLERNQPPVDTFHDGGVVPSPGHGTLVASVAASRGRLTDAYEPTEPGKITGLAPEASVLPIRAIRSVVAIRQNRIALAIQKAVEKEADIIVLCLGGPFRVGAVEAALRDARAAGVITLAAAGNCYPWVVFPAWLAKYQLCAAIAAVAKDKKPWKKSSRGKAVTVSAPGENVWGASMKESDGDVAKISPSQGTSLATAVAAGCAALFVSHHGKNRLKTIAKTRDTTIQALFLSAIIDGLTPPAEWNGSKRLGAGIIDVKKLIAFDIEQAPIKAPRDTKTVEQIASTQQVFADYLEDHTEAIAFTSEQVGDLAGELLWAAQIHQAQRRAMDDEEWATLGGAVALRAVILSPQAERVINMHSELQSLFKR